MLRWTGLPLVFVLGLGLAACPKDNPGWTLGESGSEASGMVSETTTTTTTTTSTSTTTETTDASSTTGVEPMCVDDYCPFYTDVASEPDQATCLANGGLDQYKAYLNKMTNEFFFCPIDATCPDGCTGLKLALPPEYAIFTNPLQECNYVEHEKIFRGGKCLTRSLALWNGDADPNTAAPRMILAAHTPEAPPSLTDLTIASSGAVECPCTVPSGCSANYVLPADTWCCDGKVSIHGFSMTNDVGDHYDLQYTGFLKSVTIQYRGADYFFFITQSHVDRGAGCADAAVNEPGWFMQFAG